MQAVIDFLLDYYLWVLGVLVVLLITVVGFLADTKRKKKMREKAMNEEVNNNMNSGANDFNVMNQEMTMDFNNQNNGFDPNMNQNMNSNLFVPNMNGGLNNNMMSQGNNIGMDNNMTGVNPAMENNNMVNNEVSNFNVKTPINNEVFFASTSEQKPVIEPQNVVMPTPVVEPTPVEVTPIMGVNTPTPVAEPMPALQPTPVAESVQPANSSVTMQSLAFDAVNSVSTPTITTTSPIDITMNNGSVVNPIPSASNSAPSVVIPTPSLNVTPEPIPNVNMTPGVGMEPNPMSEVQPGTSNNNYSFLQNGSSIVMGAPQGNYNGQPTNNGQ